MKNEINAVLENITATTPEPEDYTGEVNISRYEGHRYAFEIHQYT